MSEEEIGMYSTEEIYEELATGFLHHSMVDAMYFKIKDLQQKVEQLEKASKEIERLNNILNELEKELDKEYNTYITNNVIYGKTFKAGANVFREHIKYKLQELKGDGDE